MAAGSIRQFRGMMLPPASLPAAALILAAPALGVTAKTKRVSVKPDGKQGTGDNRPGRSTDQPMPRCRRLRRILAARPRRPAGGR